MVADRVIAAQFRQDGVCQHFAQLDAHLVKGVDIPDDALHKDLVLVEGDQLAQALRRQFLKEEGVGRAVAGEGLGGDQ